MRKPGLLKLGSPDWGRKDTPRKKPQKGLLAQEEPSILRGIPPTTASAPIPHVVVSGNTGV